MARRVPVRFVRRARQMGTVGHEGRASVARRAGHVHHWRAKGVRARDLVRGARPDRARTSAVEDVRSYFDRDLRAPVDAEPGSASRGFADRTGAAGGIDLVLCDGPDDLGRAAAVGASAGRLAVRASTIPLTRAPQSLSYEGYQRNMRRLFLGGSAFTA